MNRLHYILLLTSLSSFAIADDSGAFSPSPAVDAFTNVSVVSVTSPGSGSINFTIIDKDTFWSGPGTVQQYNTKGSLSLDQSLLPAGITISLTNTQSDLLAYRYTADVYCSGGFSNGVAFQVPWTWVDSGQPIHEKDDDASNAFFIEIVLPTQGGGGEGTGTG